MISLGDSVGGSSGTSPHDQALVLAMLSVIRNKAGMPYYSGDPLLKPGPKDHWQLAIETFQRDAGLLPTKPEPGRPSEPRGVVTKGGATWNLMVEQMPPYFREVRMLEGTRVVYFPMPRWKLDKNLNLFRVASRNLFGSFAENVVRLFRDFYDKTGISLKLEEDGSWRPYELQRYMNSDSGPGETIHHYGYAVDLGFDELQFLGKHGLKITADSGLAALGPQNKEKFFQARNQLARELHATTKSGDLYHLQAYDDEPLDSVSSFMKLLETFGPRKMKWTPRFRKPTDYLCDLGLGGEKYYVGTALDIWTRDRAFRISKEDLARALSERREKEPSFSADVFLGIKGSGLPASGEIAPAQIKETHLVAVQVLLKGEFLAAEAKWARWEPVNYPDGKRRIDNTRKLPKRPPRPKFGPRLVR